MRRIGIVGLCLVAALAMGLTASSVASAAAPEFITKTCISCAAGPVKIRQETVEGVAKGVGAGYLEAQVSKVRIICKDKEATTSGEITGPKTSQDNVTLFKECSTSGFACYSAGKVNEIETYPLEGELGNAAGKPAERFFREGKRGAPLAEYECGGGILTVKAVGSLVAALSITGVGATPAATKLEKTTEEAFAETKGVQKYTELEPPAVAGKEEPESYAVLYGGEVAIEWPWTGSGTGQTIKLKCGTGEGVLGELVGSHYAAAPFTLPSADKLKYYTDASITKYEETMYFIVIVEGYSVAIAEGVAAAELVATTEYAPCSGKEKSGESVTLKLESIPYKEDFGYTE